ncbi:MMPL family transporter [Phaeacidiphilus oryzae]|uniref:MMPL family transporter n=1 Tax=Phaeacidiphilus oryzae TaxID=348818 RepID=UPI000A03801A|nr:MMPL family transporter [Phaeacidiphilus oryzae]
MTSSNAPTPEPDAGSGSASGAGSGAGSATGPGTGPGAGRGSGLRPGAARLAAALCGRRGKWAVLALWIAALVVLGPLAGKLSGAENNETASWLPAGAESTQVLKLEQHFGIGDTASAVVLYTRSPAVTPADRAKAAADARSFARLHNLTGEVTGPVSSADGQALVTTVPIDTSGNGFRDLKPTVDAISSTAGTGAAPGLTLHITGPAGYGADEGKVFKDIDTTLLYSSAGVVVFLLLVTYRSPILFVLPLLAVAAALFASQAVIYLLAAHAGLTVNAQSDGILIVLVMGAGTDYALLLTARYREQLRLRADRHEAMAHALRGATPAVSASAGTVSLGMLCLMAASVRSTSSLGPVCAIGVAIALLSMLTLLPALLVATGRWAFWPRVPRYGSADPTATGFWSGVGARISRRPRLTWITTALILAVFALGATTLKADGLTNAGLFTDTPESVVGERVLAAHYPAGSGVPVLVVSKADSARTAAAVRAALARTPGVTGTTPSRLRDGYALTTGTLTAPPDSPAAHDTVDRVRDAVHAVPGAEAKTGGNTAIQLDLQRANRHDELLVLPLILGTVLLILAGLLRAVVAPLVLTATVVLSYFSALGLSSLAFDHLFHWHAEDGGYPLYVFVFLVALGVDYNIFLMTRVREESRGPGGTRAGARAGLAATGGVITSAGLILAGTFGLLGTLPLVAFAEVGFAVAVGVLIDSLVVRSVLVVALTTDLGRRIWWPSRLSRPPALPPGPGG